MTAAQGAKPGGGWRPAVGKNFTFPVAFRSGSAMFDKNVKNKLTSIKIVSKST
jgi:hypothetical protein